MQRKDIAAATIYGFPTIGLLFQGFIYLTTSEYMPYHGDALGVRWEALPSHFRAFILGVIRAMGAGSTSVSLALLIIIVLPFRRGEPWARWAVPAVGSTFTLLTAYAAYTIDIGTPATTPWRQTLGLTAIYAIGWLVTYSWPRRHLLPPG